MGGGSGPLLAIVGHIDEIGLAVTHVDDDGFVFCRRLGGWSGEVLVGQRVEILTRIGVVPAVAAPKEREPPGRGEEPKRTTMDDLYLDVGARGRDETLALVAPGDCAVLVREPLELAGGRLVSRALDNRLGCYVALEAARRIGEAGDAQVDVVAVAAVSEEVGHFGSQAAAFSLEPDLALAIDVTWATDVPGGNPRLAGKVELGGGAVIERGPMINRHVYELLVRAAEEEEVPHAFEISTRATRTDADQFHIARGGIPTGLISIPLRYMHTPCELCSLDDVEACIRLIVGFARRLTREQSYLR